MSCLFAFYGSSPSLTLKFVEKVAANNGSVVKQSAPCVVQGVFNPTLPHKVIHTPANNPILITTPDPDARVAVDFDNNPLQASNSINGPFTLLGWHAEQQILVASRDPLNQHVLYYATLPEGVVVANDAKFISALLPYKPTVNKTSVALWLSGMPSPEISLYNEINVVPLGCCCWVNSNGDIRVSRFWDIDKHHSIELANDKQYTQAWYELFDNVISDHIGSNAVLASQMSGGLDSTSITAIANNKLRASNGECISLSHVYTQSDACDERPLIDAMVKHLSLQNPILINVDEGQHRDFMALYPTAFDSPGTVLSPRYHQEMLAISQRGATAMLTGNGGDEMCWGHASAYTMRLRAGEIGVIKEVISACKRSGIAVAPVLKDLFIKPFVPLTLMNLARSLKGAAPTELPAWLSHSARNEVEQLTASLQNPFNERTNPVSYARYQSLKTTSTYNSVRSYQRVAMDYGIDVRHPFFDKRIAEFSFAVPPKQLIRGPYPKWLLRNAMSQHLPDAVCWNIKKITFDNHFGQLVKDNAKPLRELLSHPYLADEGLINTNVLLNAFDNAVQGQRALVHVDLLYAILTQRWIQQHIV